ncbi:hypothetical protein SARC_09104 [Sphaeroforma arctica JP610]|uniref:Uncharacterized protein n=1 Tax=Sphaeroforma arctica JP610 TaxID=667725 RepID=A0A0L0FPM7_9EUKA|nr:hypothetical protein SARC_09104 [Sphaeroforma arctica JP610]KNC78466.1 hypothetical protein SARC_09104 [Sphaeroforma arctica JP610]|eukprot:XP_014152368.1 hypothetical protein SARC_09104 [Sphaeroforma arctica JP610]
MVSLKTRALGIPWAGTICNIVALALLLTGCLTDYWLSGELGNVGLWRQCYYGLPCTSPNELSSYVARVMIVISLVIAFFSLFVGVGALGFFMRDFPVHILACFTVGLSGFLAILGTSIYIAGYYLGMAVSWSWGCSLAASLLQLFVTPNLYWYSYHIQAWFGRMLVNTFGVRDNTPRMINASNQSGMGDAFRESNTYSRSVNGSRPNSTGEGEEDGLELHVHAHRAAPHNSNPSSNVGMVDT